MFGASEQNSWLGAKFWVRMEILVGRIIFCCVRNFGSGTKFWVGSEILGREQNFGLAVKFWVGIEILGR